MDLNMSWASIWLLSDGVTLFGKTGRCTSHLGRPSGRTELDGDSVDIRRSLKEGEGWNTAFRQHELFARNVAAGEQPSASAADGRDVQRVLAALYRSDAAGASVEV